MARQNRLITPSGYRQPALKPARRVDPEALDADASAEIAAVLDAHAGRLDELARALVHFGILVAGPPAPSPNGEAA